MNPTSNDDTIPDLAGGISCSNGESRLKVVQRLWTSMMTIFPHATLAAAAEKLLACLIIAEEVVLPGSEGRSCLECFVSGYQQHNTARYLHSLTLSPAQRHRQRDRTAKEGPLRSW